MGKQSRSKDARRPVRTRLGLMAEIVAEASGRSLAECRSLLEDIKAVKGAPGDGPMSESEYQTQRAELMTELPGIRAWLIRGAAEADPREFADFRWQAAHRN